MATDPGQALWQTAQERFPFLRDAKMRFMYQPKGVERTGKLEFYAPDETRRPMDMPLGQPGVAVFDPDVRPDDIAADYASHYGRQRDPVIKANYDRFVNSMTDRQRQILLEQYQHARTHEGEKRPFDVWAEVSGRPAWYRGYLFNQWPQEFIDAAFLPAQRAQLDEIRSHLYGK